MFGITTSAGDTPLIASQYVPKGQTQAQAASVYQQNGYNALEKQLQDGTLPLTTPGLSDAQYNQLLNTRYQSLLKANNGSTQGAMQALLHGLTGDVAPNDPRVQAFVAGLGGNPSTALTPGVAAPSASPGTPTAIAASTPARAMTPSGSANDVSTPASSVGAILNGNSSGAPSATGSPPPGAAPGTVPGTSVSLTPTDPNNPLTAQTISAGPTADRFGIAKDQLSDVIKNILDPQFAADQRTLSQNAAARGQVGSGMFRTNLGNLDLARQHDIDSTASSFLNNALTGSIDDAYRNVGIAQQQQGFQNQQQQEAFSNSMQQLLAGEQGDPTQILQWLAQYYALPVNYGGN